MTHENIQNARLFVCGSLSLQDHCIIIFFLNVSFIILFPSEEWFYILFRQIAFQIDITTAERAVFFFFSFFFFAIIIDLTAVVNITFTRRTAWAPLWGHFALDRMKTSEFVFSVYIRFDWPTENKNIIYEWKLYCNFPTIIYGKLSAHAVNANRSNNAANTVRIAKRIDVPLLISHYYYYYHRRESDNEVAGWIIHTGK